MLSLHTQYLIAQARSEAQHEAEIVLCDVWENIFPVKQKPYIELIQGDER